MPLESARRGQQVVSELRASVTRIRTDRVTDESIRQRVRAFVDYYKNSLRSGLATVLADTAALDDLDLQMRTLLVLAQRDRTRKSSYLAALRDLKGAWDNVEVRAADAETPVRGQTASDDQARILKTLEEVCPSAAASYAQALADLAFERRSWRGPAVDLREALREVLDVLAPDKEVMNLPGFKLEDGAKGPTMKQKTHFILKAREQSSDARKAVEQAVNVIEEQVGAFVRSVYTRASGSVHVQRSKKEVLSIQRFVETTLIELLQL